MDYFENKVKITGGKHKGKNGVLRNVVTMEETEETWKQVRDELLFSVIIEDEPVVYIRKKNLSLI